jgi:hypothetical protein
MEEKAKKQAEKCLESKEFDKEKILKLSYFDFAVMYWNLETGRHETTGLYDEGAFLATYGTHKDVHSDLLNNINNIRRTFLKYI